MLYLFLFELALFLYFHFKIWLAEIFKEIHITRKIRKPDDFSSCMFREGWVTVNGVHSHVLTWGGWIEDPLPKGDYVVVFMCGIPGITLFYHDFLEALYSHLRVPVWTISIAGHEIPPPETKYSLPKNTNLFNNVEAQVAHKRAFIEEHVPTDRKILLIGHSFGAKMVMELLKDKKLNSRVHKSVLLMPTIEKFGETPRAKFWLFMSYSGLVYLFVLITWILYFLPTWYSEQFSSLYFRLHGLDSVPERCFDAMVQVCNPTVFYNVRSLVYNELDAIKHLDQEVLTDCKDKMKVYFAPVDKWAPLTHHCSLTKAVPDLPVEVLDSRFKHAFTLEAAEEMAEILIKDLSPELICQ